MSWRWLISLILGLACMGNSFAQSYIHPLAKQTGEDSFTYYLNADGDVVSELSEYSLIRTAQREKRKKPYSFITKDFNGQVLERGYSEYPDPIFERYAGTYLAYLPNGDTTSYFAYKKARRHGPQKTFYRDGTLKSSGQYHKGLRTGIWVDFYQSGDTAEVKRFKDGLPYGVWERFHPNGSVEWRLGFIKGIPVGAEVQYFDDGEVEMIQTYQGKARSGKFLRYFPDGAIAEQGNFKSDLEDGEWLASHPNGVTRFKGTYAYGERVGPWLKLNQAGDTLLYGTYSKDGFNGFEQGYSEAEKQVYRTTFTNGQKVLTQLLDADGNCFGLTLGDEHTLRSCNDTSLTGAPGLYEEPRLEDNLEVLLAENLARLNIPGLELYGVYRFTVNRNGRVRNLEVVETADRALDDEVLSIIGALPWENGSYYGYPARFTNELAVRVSNGDVMIQLGRAYVDDAVLMKQSNVPVQTGHVKQFKVSPSFPGGEEKMFAWLAENLTFPDWALAKQLSGETMVQFTVERSGVLSGIEIETNAYPSLDYEALRVTQMMPLWKPGEKEGEEVRTVYKLPFRFTLR